MSIVLPGVFAIAQNQVIHIKNPSFESNPTPGGINGFLLPDWHDCAPYYFNDETAPDIHGNGTNIFDVKTKPQEGNTFLGMVTRAKRDSWEMVSQQLTSPLVKGKCYEFSIHLARSNIYNSNVDAKDPKKHNFNSPIKLRIWGSTSPCKKTQLLAQTDLIENNEWKKFTLRFKPKRNYYFIMLEAFFKTPVLFPYNGNILLDNASDIVEVPCPGDELLAKIDISDPEPVKTIKTYKKPVIKTSVPKKHETKKTEPKKSNNPEVIVKNKPKESGNSDTSQKKKILKKLDKDKITTGQTIKIENLFFEADSSNIKPESYPVLDEIYDFLKNNPNVIIEIGGHTNDIPGTDYCNRLSTARAKKVAEYLYHKGIPKYRIKYKGYGKKQPLVNNRTAWGRKQNQRVEIKILRIG